MRKITLVLIALLTLSACKKDKNNNTTVEASNNVGSSAPQFLRSGQFTSLEVQVLYMQGEQPSTIATDSLKSFLEALCNKPAGVFISLKEIPALTEGTYSLDRANQLEADNRTVYNNGTKLSTCILIVDGDYNSNSGSSKVLGVAYKNTSIILYGKTIRDASGGIGKPSKAILEAAVLRHEMGHLLGLVSLGTPMQTNHLDQGNGNHCSDGNCLMNYKLETNLNLGSMGFIPQLDSQCRNDLKAAGGR